MISTLYDYTSRELGLKMTDVELKTVYATRDSAKYQYGHVELTEIPGFKIIDPNKAGNGSWNLEKMSRQSEDMMHAIDVLEPKIQQLHQYVWSSGHAMSQEGGLLIASMNLNYG